MRFVSLSNVSVNLNSKSIGDAESKYLLEPISNQLNLSRISLNLRKNSISSSGAESLLSDLPGLVNL